MRRSKQNLQRDSPLFTTSFGTEKGRVYNRCIRKVEGKEVKDEIIKKMYMPEQVHIIIMCEAQQIKLR